MTDGEFKQQILPLYGKMYTAAYVILRNRADACDTVQEVVTRLWEHRHRLAVEVSPNSLCATAVRNCCIDMLRRRQGRVSFDNEILKECNTPSSLTSDAQASYNTLLTAISHTASTMNDMQRNVLLLSLISRLNNEEIEQATGQSAANVRQMLSRGRRKLKETLAHEL